MEGHDNESRCWIGRAWVWVCELVEEIWEDGGDIVKDVLGASWDFLRVLKMQFWVAVLVGGIAFAVAYPRG